MGGCAHTAMADMWRSEGKLLRVSFWGSNLAFQDWQQGPFHTEPFYKGQIELSCIHFGVIPLSLKRKDCVFVVAAIVLFSVTVFLCGPTWSGPCYVVQVDLGPIAILLPRPPELLP